MGKFQNFHSIEPLARPLLPLFRWDAPHLEAELNVLLDVQKWKQCETLPDHRSISFDAADLVDWLVIQTDHAFTGFFQPRQHAQGGCLAAPGGAHNGEKFPLVDLQIHRVHRNHGAITLGDTIK